MSRRPLPPNTRTQLVQCAVRAEALGVVVLTSTLFVKIPLFLIVCIPIGAGLAMVGALVWLWAFLWAD